MSKWAQMRNGIVGMVVAKVKLPSGLAFGLDLNGNGGIFYVMARECKPFDLPKLQNPHVCKRNCDCRVCNCCTGFCELSKEDIARLDQAAKVSA